MRKFKTLLTVILISAAAFILRVIFLNEKVFSSSDETNFLLASFDLYSIFFSRNITEAAGTLYRLLNFVWGPIVPIFQVFFLALYGFFNIRLTEFSLTLPFTIMGTLYVPLVFMLSKYFFNKWAALIAALFTAIIPLFTQTSRYTAATGLMDGFLLMFLILFWAEHIFSDDSIRKTKKLLIGALIALNCLTDSQFLGIFIFLPAFILYRAYIKKEYPLKVFKERVLDKFIILPSVFVLTILFICWLYPSIKFGNINTTALGHLFNKSGQFLNIGFHFKNLIRSISLSAGPIISLLMPLSAIYGIFLLKRRRKSGIVFFWLIFYSAPLLFLVSVPIDHRDYFHTWLIPLIILASSLISILYEYLSRRLNRTVSILFIFSISVSIFLITFLSTLGALFNAGPFKEPAYYGRVEENSGIKTAGYYFRDTLSENQSILSDFGMPIIKYYFNHSPLGERKFLWTSFSPSLKEKYAHIAEKSLQADIIVLNYENYLRAGQNFSNSGFYIIGKVFSNQKPKIIILSRQKQEYKRMDTEIYDRLFDREFGNWHSLYIPAYYKY